MGWHIGPAAHRLCGSSAIVTMRVDLDARHQTLESSDDDDHDDVSVSDELHDVSSLELHVESSLASSANQHAFSLASDKLGSPASAGSQHVSSLASRDVGSPESAGGQHALLSASSTSPGTHEVVSPAPGSVSTETSVQPQLGTFTRASSESPERQTDGSITRIAPYQVR